MDSKSWLQLLRQHRAIAVIRTANPEIGFQMAKAVVAGRMHLVEITWNSERPAELVERIRTELPDCIVGAGTILNQAQVQEAIAAGAQYLFTPHSDANLIQTALDREVPIVPGGLTPTEIMHAWQMGASCVKVFPVKALGGSSYIHCLQGPLGHIPLIPTGGVTLANTKDFLTAGAIAVGLASDLFPRQALINGNWELIRDQARSLVQQLAILKG